MKAARNLVRRVSLVVAIGAVACSNPAPNAGSPTEHVGSVSERLTFNLLHSFEVNSEGGTPLGSLTVLGSTLYGMTYRGGEWDHGTLFKVNTDSTGFSRLLSFPFFGAYPMGDASLTVSGSTLYGMTYYGGASDLGDVFKVNTDGTGY